jgi:hypothetical protein
MQERREAAAHPEVCMGTAYAACEKRGVTPLRDSALPFAPDRSSAVSIEPVTSRARGEQSRTAAIASMR